MNSTASTLRHANNQRHGADQISPRLRYKHLAFGVGFALGSLLVVGVASAASGVAATQTPTGGQVVGGVGSIAQRGADTIVNQQSSLLSLNWQSFNVGKDASVLFKQPGLSAVALNRILDQNPSQIFGKISSNGQVFLINTHGIIFGASAQLNVGGLVASTLDLTPSDFLQRHFNLDANGGNAAVVNHGTIAAASGGSVSLIGGQVENDGLIVADYGHINLDGADQAVLNFDGNGLINVQITGALKQRFDADQAAVVNKGTLQAASGTVVLQASAAKNLFTNLVNNSGVIDAHGISTAGGVVRLVGDGGNVIDSGNINVSGTTGGSAQLLSDQNVGVTGGTINASGTNGGGSIRVGGGWQGGEGLQTASAAYIAPDATLDASATQLGNGGSVVVWGNNVNNFYGSIFARGGALGGNGGRVETSSHYGLNAQGTVDASAPHGVAGLWLLDPYNVTINGTGGTTFSNPFTATAASTILNTDVNAALTGGTSVSIFTGTGGTATAGDITVNAPIKATGAATLSLQAAGSIFLNANISGDGTDALNVNLWANYGGTAGFTPGVTNYTSNSSCAAMSGCVVDIGGTTGASSITTNGGALDIETGTGGGALAIGNATYAGNIDTGAGALTVKTAGVSEGKAGSNIVAGAATFDVGANAIALGDGGNNLSGVVSLNNSGANDVTLNNGSNALLLGTSSVGTGTLSLTSGALSQSGSIKQAAGAGDVTLDTGTNTLALSNANNSFTGAITILGAGAAELNSTGTLTVGTVSNTGSLTLDGASQLDGNVSTSGSQTYTGAVTLDNDVVLTSTAGSVNFGSTVDSQNATARSLEVDATAGQAKFVGAIGGTHQLNDLTVDSDTLATPATVSVGGDLSITTTAALATSTSWSGANVTLDSGGNLTLNGDVTATAANGAVQLTSGGNLAINAAVNSGAGTTTLTQTGTGAITEDATNGSITAGTLTGSSTGSTTLGSASNAITDLGAFTAVGFSLTNGQALDVTGAVNAGTGNASLTTKAGDLTVDGTGTNTGSVTGSTVGLSANAGNLAINGAVNSGAGTTTLTQAGTGAISEDATTGKITAGTLTGSSTGDTTLTGNNQIMSLGSFGAKDLTLTNAAALVVAGPIATTGNTGNISLTTASGNALTVNQALTGGAITLDSGSNLTVGQNVTGTAVDLAANGNLAINAAVNSGTGTTTLTQTGTGAITEDATNGSITAGTLTGSSTGSTTLGSASNAITDLGAFTAVGFSLTNGQALDVTGAVNAGTGNASLTTKAGDLTVDGTGTNTGSVTGSTVGLSANAGNLAINGAVNSGTGTTTLMQAGTGAISEDATTGKITAGTLTGSSTGDTTLTGNNQITSLGSFGAKDLTLTNAAALVVAGPITTTGNTGNISLTTTSGNALTVNQALTGGAITLDSGSNLTVGQNVTGTAVDLAANGNLAINAAVNSGTGTTMLTQTGVGVISEGAAGTITAGLLTGDSTGGATLGNAANAITDLGAFTAVGFSLTNGQALDVTGAVNAGSGVASLTAATGDLTIDSAGSVAGSSVGLTASAGNLAITGTLNSGAGIASLTAGAGAITETGKIVAGTLTGNSTGATTLGSATNRIANLGNFTALGFSLTDAAALNVTGTVNAGTGSAALTTTGAGNDLTVANAGAVEGSAVGLTSGSNLVINGAVNSGAGATTLTQSGTGAIGEGATGVITAATLTGSSVGDTTLDGNNQIATLGSFTAKDFALVDAANLTVNGPVSTTNNLGDIGFTTTAGHTLNVGQVSTGGAVTLNSGSDLTIAQAVSGSTVTLGADGNLAINAAVNSGTGTTTLTQTGTGAITESGSIVAGTLTGSSTGSTTLGSATNQIANLGDFTALGFSLTNAQALDVTGSATAGTGAAALTTTVGDLTIAGGVQGGSVDLKSAGDIDISGTLDGTVTGGTGAVALTAAGAINETAATGVVKATTLSGSSAGDTTLGGNNQIAELDTFTAKDLTLVNDANLDVAGPISTTGNTGNISFTTTTGHTLTVGQILAGGAITLDSGSDLDVSNAITGSAVNLGANGNLAINAAVNSGTGTTHLTQTGTGAITEDATNGLITAGTLTGSSAGDTTLVGNNQITTLGGFNAKDLTLVDAHDLSVAGPISTAGGGGNISLTTTTGHALNVGQMSTGGALTLDSGSDLTVAQNVTGASVNLAANGTLAINATVNSGTGTTTLTQTGTGAITEDPTNGVIIAGHLTGSSVGDTTLGGNNQIGELDTFSAKDLTLVDDANLNAVGLISTTGNTGNISFTTTTGHTLTVGQILAGGSITLDSGSDLDVNNAITGSTVNLGAHGNLAVNAAVNSGTGTTTLTQTGAGAITESTGSGSITAGMLTGSSVGSTTLGSAANAIADLGSFTAVGFSLTNGGALTVTGGVDADSGAASLTTNTGDLTLANGASVTGGTVGLTASAGSLAINGAVDSGTGTTMLTQTGTGAITEDAVNGTITAGTLTGSSTGDTTLGGNNQIATLGGFDAKDLTLVNAADLSVAGPISTTGGTGNISLTTTTGHTLGVGQIATGGALTLNSGSNLTVAQNVSGSTVNLAANGNLAINATVNSGVGTTTLTQSGAGAITEDPSGVIIAGHLTGSSVGDTTLTGNNQIGELDLFGAKDLTLVDAHDLNVAGPITTTGGNGSISFTTTPGFALSVGRVLTGGAITLDSGKDLSIVNGITGSTVNLAANGSLAINAAVNSGSGTTTLTQTGTGAISENPSGSIVAGTLTGSSTGSTTLGGTANQIGNLGSFNANGFSLTDNHGLTVLAGATVNGGNSVQLATTGAGNNLALDGHVQATQVQLNSAGTLSEGTGGMLQSAVLSGSSVGATTLGATNAIGSLGNFTAAGFALTNGQALTVANGATVNGGSSAAITTTGTGSDLTINGTLTGTTTTLMSSGGIGEGTNGAIVAANLTGSSVAATSLAGNNQIANLGNFTADGFALNDAQTLTVAAGATVNGGNATSLATSGSGSNLALNGTITGTTTKLNSAGAISEGTSGSIQTTTLTGSAANAAQLTGNNAISSLGNFTAQGLALTNGQALTIASGATVDGGATTTLTIGGAGGDLAVDGTLKGTTTTLLASGAISEGANGSLQAGTLTGSSVGATTLAGGNNNVANLGNFTAAGFNLATASGLTVAAGSTVDGGGSTTLTTTGGGGAIAINGNVKGTVTKLVAAGAINEGGSGGITAGTLTGSSVGDTTLNGANQVAGLGAFTAANFYLTDAQALAVGGPLATSGNTGNISLVTTGGTGNTLTVNQAVHGGAITMTSAGDLTVANAIVGNKVNLTADGNLAIAATVDSGSGLVTLTQTGTGGITGGPNGGITAGTLTGTSAGATELGSAAQFMDNHVGVLGGFVAPGGFSFTNGQTLTLASVNGSAFTVNAGQSPVYLAVQNGDLLQNGTNWLYDSVGTWSSTGHIGLATAPIYVMGVSNQTVSSIGLPPAYFYAIDAQGNLLPIISPVGVPSSVNVPAAMLSTNAQGVNGHTDRYIDISVITANYRGYGVVAPGLLLPPDQLECSPDQSSSAQCPDNGN